MLFIAHDSGLYGAQLSLMQILTGMDKGLFEPIVIAPNYGPFIEHLTKAGIPAHIIPMPKWVPPRGKRSARELWKFMRSFPDLVNQLRAFIKHNGIDIVYTNTVVCIHGAVAATMTGRRHIWHIREHVRGNREIAPYLPARLIPCVVSLLSDQIITNSKSLHSDFVGKFTRCRADVIYNGIDLEKFNRGVQDDKPCRRDLGIPDDYKLVGIIGAIHPRKGHKTFLEAARLIKTELDNVAFLIIGGGSPDYVRQIRELGKELGVDDRAYFLGWRSDVISILKELDVLVLASEQEPFGRVIIEAMAAGKPVVATACGGPKEIIIHGETGLIVPIGDGGSMAKAILKIIVEDLGKSFGESGKRRVESLFQEKRYLEGIETLIKRTVA